MKDKTYIFGHKNPDTDSVCSAISLSYLKNSLGFNTEPRILSNINEETKYVLNKFKFEIPKILDDVKLQVSDVNYHKNFTISSKESVYNAFFKMQEENMSTIPIINENNQFIGAFAMKDIAKKEILKSLLPPTQKRIAFSVALKLKRSVFQLRVARPCIVDHHGMIDNQVNRHKWVNFFRIAF